MFIKRTTAGNYSGDHDTLHREIQVSAVELATPEEWMWLESAARDVSEIGTEINWTNPFDLRGRRKIISAHYFAVLKSSMK